MSITVCVLYNLWTLIVRQSFPELQERGAKFWFFFDYTSDTFVILDILVQFRTGYLEQGKRKKKKTNYIPHKNILKKKRPSSSDFFFYSHNEILNSRYFFFYKIYILVNTSFNLPTTGSVLREEVTFLSSLVTLYLPIYSLVIFFVTAFFSLFYLFNYFKVVNKRVLQAYDHYNNILVLS